ncbi:helix-turn-helix domain-containing protein [Massilia sp. DWR3-1-1]|uniref:helix-turn-helix domain-containing protein n=1 Tax=Massilia sp. DWR3-1-1 TaxID=2804559 RepID=UPI003CFB3A1A
MENDFKGCIRAPAMGEAAAVKELPTCALCGARRACVPTLFQAIDSEVFDSVIYGKRRIDRNAILCTENDKFDMLYIVRFGQLKMLRRDPSGILHVVKFYMPGDIIGMDAIATGVHCVRVMALENSELCEVSYRHLKQAMADAPQFTERFVKTMSRALADDHERSCVLSLSNLDERFASFLLDLSNKYERQGYSGRSFRLSMTRGDIGSYLGTTVETVSRLIARFNAHHGVSITGRLVEVHDREQLLAVLDVTRTPQLISG